MTIICFFLKNASRQKAGKYNMCKKGMRMRKMRMSVLIFLCINFGVWGTYQKNGLFIIVRIE